MNTAAQTQATVEAYIVRYDVTNIRTGKVTSYKSRNAASNAQDRADNAYGACCTTCKAIWSDEVQQVAA